MDAQLAATNRLQSILKHLLVLGNACGAVDAAFPHVCAFWGNAPAASIVGSVAAVVQGVNAFDSSSSLWRWRPRRDLAAALLPLHEHRASLNLK